MPGIVLLMQCVGRAAAKNAGRALARLVPFGEAVFDVALDTYDEYYRNSTEADLKSDLVGLAQAAPAEVRQVAEAIAAQVAAGQPPEVQQALAVYLNQLPASIRQILRRPADPSGTTMPASMSIKKPENLAPFLPSGLPRFQAGDRPLAADWELVEMLGKGGFGEVWKTRHIHQTRKKPVALKFCLDDVAAATLRNEASLHDHLDRVREEVAAPGIVTLLETYLSADPPCLMYEFIEGGDLAGLIQELAGQGRLTARLATQIVQRLATIVASAHGLKPPLVHRDLKPSNFLVRPAPGELPELFVADFGIGSLAAGQALRNQEHRPTIAGRTLPTAIRGAYTPLYASPQQVRGDKPDPRDDVHALGVIWYQLATGDLGLMAVPPDWQDVVEERGLSSAQTRLLAACIASRVEKRPANAGELATALAGTLNESAAPPAPLSTAPSKPVNPPPATVPAPTPLQTLVPVRAPAPTDDQEDDDEATSDGDSAAFLLGITILSGVVAAVVGWFVGGMLWLFLAGFIGWFVGIILGLVVSAIRKHIRTRGTRLIAQAKQLVKEKKDAEALELFRRALAHNPNSVEALVRSAAILLRSEQLTLRNSTTALEYAQRAAQAPGTFRGRALWILADVHKALGQHGAARAALEQALENNPDGAASQNQLAWLYATSPDPEVRDGPKAVQLASSACARTQWQQPHMLDTLAAAHAEAGQFDEAVHWQKKALEGAPEHKKNDYESRIRLYELRQPFRVYTEADDS